MIQSVSVLVCTLFNSYILSDVSFADLIQKILPLSAAYLHINAFITSKIPYANITSPTIPDTTRPSPGLVTEAFCEALGKLIKGYQVYVVAIESQVKQNQLSLQMLYNNVFPTLQLMQGIEDVITKIEEDKAKGVCVISSFLILIVMNG